MRALLNLMILDTILLLRNLFFWIIFASLVLIILTINFLIPSSDLLEKNTMVAFGLLDSPPGIERLESETNVLDFVTKHGGVGLIARKDNVQVLNGGLSDKAVHNLVLSIFGTSSENGLPVEYLRQRARPIPSNLQLLPIFICFEALIVGFFMGGILLLSEKEQRTLLAFRVSPGTTLSYVSAKAILLSFCGAFYALAMAVFTIGLEFNWIAFFSLSFISSMVFTLLGILTTVFFKDLNSWFLIAILILSVNMVSALGYSNPSFSSFWIRLLPSYPMIFGFDEVLFPTGKSLLPILSIVSLESLVLFAITVIVIHFKLFHRQRGLK